MRRWVQLIAELTVSCAVSAPMLLYVVSLPVYLAIAGLTFSLFATVISVQSAELDPERPFVTLKRVMQDVPLALAMSICWPSLPLAIGWAAWRKRHLRGSARRRIRGR